jgi:hypothetical protein
VLTTFETVEAFTAKDVTSIGTFSTFRVGTVLALGLIARFLTATRFPIARWVVRSFLGYGKTD